MLTLTYIFHSCFVVDTDEAVLIFDYWLDPTKNIHHIFQCCKGKSVYVFASHFHEDHFTQDIFKWRTENTDVRFIYILSKDILKHRRAEKSQADAWLAKGGYWVDSRIKVTATGSNDSGVSWIIDITGVRIFHAGDLCNWYAKFLEGDTPPNLICDKMGQTIQPVKEEKRFLGELKEIRKHTNYFDIAMFPIDGRIGNGYTRGARQFIKTFNVKLLVPMHFAAGGCPSTWRMLPFCQNVHTSFWRIQKTGESIAVSNGLIIRLAHPADLPCLQQLFAHARQFMADTGNPNQWPSNYPSKTQLNEDIISRSCFMVEQDNLCVATFVLKTDEEPAYQNIHDGEWTDNRPYITIHRIASTGQCKGILHQAVKFAISQYHRNIRIDTHHDNAIMQRAIQKEGFRYCGLVHYEHAGERLAYQLSIPKQEDLTFTKECK